MRKPDPEHARTDDADDDFARFAAHYGQRFAGRDVDQLSTEELREFEAMTDPLIQLVAQAEAMRPDSRAYNDPRFLEWLARERREAREAQRARERRGNHCRSSEALTEQQIKALAARVIARVQAERSGIRDYRGRPAVGHGPEPLRVSEMVETLRGSERATVTDPIGLEGGINLYAYTDNSPIGRLDPFGLEWQCTTTKYTVVAEDGNVVEGERTVCKDDGKGGGGAVAEASLGAVLRAALIRFNPRLAASLGLTGAGAASVLPD